ncbi:hypothetical protein JW698_00490 [Candidatus Wolfebacteria bacterium]|nr:hypothetical protein [Candidatus Wolfebacteria bacterium]
MFIDYNKLINDFKKLALEDRLSHAYLFFGGDERSRQDKFNFAHCLANFLENGSFEKPLKLLTESLILLPNNDIPEKKGSIGIDEIRFLKYFLWQRPVNSLRRVSIIKEAETLTLEAQNAALKIVEEPPESALIIFIANSEDVLFPTLKSRLQKIYFPSFFVLNKEEAKNNKKTDEEKEIEKLVNKFQKTPLSDEEIDKLFKNLIANFGKEPIKNSHLLKKTLKYLTLIKQFNVNKRLQLRALFSEIK